MSAIPDHPLLSGRAGSRSGKVVSAAEAMALVHSGDTVVTSGFIGSGFAEGLAKALERESRAT